MPKTPGAAQQDVCGVRICARIGALAAQTFRSGRSVDEMVGAFRGRLSALSAAMDAILEDGRSSAQLRDVVERILSPYRTLENDPFLVEGVDVELDAQRATAIGMALHELCTNAVKYGALSVAAGRVSIAWRLDGERLVLLDFGLAYYSERTEDAATDVRLIKEILGSAHVHVMNAFESFVEGYASFAGKKRAGRVLENVHEIEQRGRYARVT